MEPARSAASGATNRATLLRRGRAGALAVAAAAALTALGTVGDRDAADVLDAPPKIVSAFVPDAFPGTPAAAAAGTVEPEIAPVERPKPKKSRFRGLAFDTCRAPSLAAMQAWRESPYRAVGIYVSGKARACKNQRHLTPEWVAKFSASGWRLIPIDVSEQAPCHRFRNSRYAIDHDRASEQGAAAARGAVAAAAALGILPGSALYSDIEHYGPAPDRACVVAVADFLDGWTRQLHDLGYLAGMYGHVGSGVRHASDRYLSDAYRRLDAVWMAHWDRRRNLENWPGVHDSHWADGARIKQFRGDHLARHGGVALHIDSNVVDAPVATVASDLLGKVLGGR